MNVSLTAIDYDRVVTTLVTIKRVDLLHGHTIKPIKDSDLKTETLRLQELISFDSSSRKVQCKAKIGALVLK